MGFMRLGTRIAVINEADEILLSKRGDFGVWALPGGRVDSGELLHESAIREVAEETGLQVEIERPVGLYFQAGRSRLNILYRARPVGGTLFGKTDETLDNQFFARDQLPDNIFGQIYIDHAYTDETHLYTMKSSRLELLKLDLKLRWRWLQNLLAGRPEPKFAHFTIRAIGLIDSASHSHVDTQANPAPVVTSDGRYSLPEALNRTMRQPVNWRWVGLWQDTSTDQMDFVFADNNGLQSSQRAGGDSENERIQRYIEFTQQSTESIWFLEGDI